MESLLFTSLIKEGKKKLISVRGRCQSERKETRPLNFRWLDLTRVKLKPEKT